MHVGLTRVVPEALKPRKIVIGTGMPAIEGHANDGQASIAQATPKAA